MHEAARHPNPETSVYLASASPRRQELLRQVGIGFEVWPSNIVEAQRPEEAARDYVRRVAAEKARHVAELVGERGLTFRPVLGADTEVVLEDEILGKPRDPAHAEQMLARLAGRTHTVLSALCLVTAAGEHTALSVSRVTLVSLSRTDIARYVACGEALDKAGGYAIQGRAAGFIERLEGSYSGVMGLPLFELCATLRDAGIEWP
jgi:nucleoside triphosphate pyrophosphatase